MGPESQLRPPVVKSTYPQRVRQNILRLSQAKTLPQAFKEWRFTGNVHDHEKPVAACGLCDKNGLRYHFQIENDYNHCGLWVGSTCILKFGIAVFEDGVRLDRDRAQRKLNGLETEMERKLSGLSKKMRHESCVKALQCLSNKEDSDVLFNVWDYYCKNRYLTPKYAAHVFPRLKRYGIDHNPEFFEVNLKTSNYKRDLREMPSDRVNTFWAALSPSQQRLAARLGHSGPNGGGR